MVFRLVSWLVCLTFRPLVPLTQLVLIGVGHLVEIPVGPMIVWEVHDGMVSVILDPATGATALTKIFLFLPSLASVFVNPTRASFMAE